MTVDNITALGARDDLLWIAAHWSNLTAQLAPGNGNALTGMPSNPSGERGLVIDTYISDLMHEITENVARNYGRILLAESHDDPITTSAMPDLLIQVAHRYGHFTNDPDLATGFCDDAHDYRHRVHKALTRPAPPTYIGPCPTTNCEGELHLRTGQDIARCPNCGTNTTHLEQKAWLDDQMSDRLMTATELGRALTILDIPTKPATIRKWISRGRLEEAAPDTGLYRLNDAKHLATTRHTRETA